jgi:hypothetical protein
MASGALVCFSYVIGSSGQKTLRKSNEKIQTESDSEISLPEKIEES